MKNNHSFFTDSIDNALWVSGDAVASPAVPWDASVLGSRLVPIHRPESDRKRRLCEGDSPSHRQAILLPRQCVSFPWHWHWLGGGFRRLARTRLTLLFLPLSTYP